jgi:hypothetical protein
MLTADEIAQLRADATASLPDTCDILRSTRQPDGRGGQVTVWAAIATAVPCRLAPASQGVGNEDMAGARLTAESDWMLTLAWDQVLTTQDRIRIGTEQYEVKGIIVRSWQLFTRVGLVSLGIPAKVRVERIREYWNDFDASLWDDSTSGSISVANGQLLVNFASGERYAGATNGGEGYSLRDGYLSAEILSVGEGATFRDVLLLAYSNAQNQAAVQYENGELFIKFRDGGVNGDSEGIPYDPLAHRWWRIIATNNVLTFQVSANGAIWSNPWGTTRTAGSWIDAVNIYLDTIASNGDAGSAVFDNVTMVEAT